MITVKGLCILTDVNTLSNGTANRMFHIPQLYTGFLSSFLRCWKKGKTTEMEGILNVIILKQYPPVV